MAKFEVKYYRVFLGNGTMRNSKIIGSIMCMDDNVHWSSSLTICFVPDGTPLPPAWSNAGEEHGGLFRPISQAPLFLDVLRNEKPVYGWLSASTPDSNSLTTSNEPIGEGE